MCLNCFPFNSDLNGKKDSWYLDKGVWSQVAMNMKGMCHKVPRKGAHNLKIGLDPAVNPDSSWLFLTQTRFSSDLSYQKLHFLDKYSYYCPVGQTITVPVHKSSLIWGSLVILLFIQLKWFSFSLEISSELIKYTSHFLLIESIIFIHHIFSKKFQRDHFIINFKEFSFRNVLWGFFWCFITKIGYKIYLFSSRIALMQPSFSGLLVTWAYFPQTTFPPEVTRPSSLMLTSMIVPFVMTPWNKELWFNRP